MGQQIIKQPNGKYCVWSTTVQNIIYYDCTRNDLIEYRLAEGHISSDVQQREYKKL